MTTFREYLDGVRPRGKEVGTMVDGEALWVKSSASRPNGDCVEVAGLPDGRVGVRHSKDPSGPVLRFTPAEWHAFLAGAQAGEFDAFGVA